MTMDLEVPDKVPLVHNLRHIDNDIQVAYVSTNKSRLEYQRISKCASKNFAEVSTVVLITSLSSSVSLTPLKLSLEIAPNIQLGEPFSCKRQPFQNAKHRRMKPNFCNTKCRSQRGATRAVETALNNKGLSALRYSSTWHLHRQRALDHFYSIEATRRIAHRPDNGIRYHLHALLRQARSKLLSISPAKACLLDTFTEHILGCSPFKQPTPSSREKTGGIEKRDAHFSDEMVSPFIVSPCGGDAAWDGRPAREATRGKKDAGRSPALKRCERARAEPAVSSRPIQNCTTATAPSFGCEVGQEPPTDASLTVEEKLLYVILRTSLLDGEDDGESHCEGGEAACQSAIRSFPKGAGSASALAETQKRAPNARTSAVAAYASSFQAVLPSMPSSVHHWDLDYSEEVAQLDAIVNPLCPIQGNNGGIQESDGVDALHTLAGYSSVGQSTAAATATAVTQSAGKVDDLNTSSESLAHKRAKLERDAAGGIGEQSRKSRRRACANERSAIARTNHYRSHYLLSLGAREGPLMGDARCRRQDVLLPREPRCWLSPATVRLVERSEALQRVLCWSAEPDPVVETMLWRNVCGARSSVSFGGIQPSFSDPDAWLRRLASSGYEGEVEDPKTYNSWFQSSSLPYRTPYLGAEGVRGAAMTEWGDFVEQEGEVDTLVRSLFEHSPKGRVTKQESSSPTRYNASGNSGELSKVDNPDRSTVVDPPVPLPSSVSVPLTVERPLSIFSSTYGSNDTMVLSTIYTALHCCVVGLQDPLLFVVIHRPPDHTKFENKHCAKHATGDEYEKVRETKRYRKGDQPAQWINQLSEGSAERMLAAPTVGINESSVYMSLSDDFFVLETKSDIDKGPILGTSDDASMHAHTSVIHFFRKEDDLEQLVPTLENSGKPESPPLRQTYEGCDNRRKRCPCGLLSLLQWGCIQGTLYLRLRYLCQVADQPENRVGLGSYGRSAVEALRTCLSLIQRQVVELAARSGNPCGVTFEELINAQRRLRKLSESIEIMARVFCVNTSDDWDATKALQGLSSATLLTTLYEHYTARYTNALMCTTDAPNTVPRGDARREGHPPPRVSTNSTKDCNTSAATEEKLGHHFTSQKEYLEETIDVIAFILLEALKPLHHMLHAWVTRSVLVDPFDEFFIIFSHEAASCGFALEASPHRLPSFISLEAARNFLYAGISIRTLRAAATDLILSAKKYERELQVREDLAVDLVELTDARLIHTVVKNFVDALAGVHSTTCVDLFSEKGALNYWRGRYDACNDLLLSAALQDHPDEVRRSEDTGPDDDDESHKEGGNRDRLVAATANWRGSAPLQLDVENLQHQQQRPVEQSAASLSTTTENITRVAEPQEMSRSLTVLLGQTELEESTKREDIKERSISVTFKKMDPCEGASERDAGETAPQPVTRMAADVDNYGCPHISFLTRQDGSCPDNPRHAKTLSIQTSSRSSALGASRVAASKSVLRRGSAPTALSVTSSRATTALHEAISEEIRQVVSAVKQRERTNEATDHALRREHERQMLAQKRENRLSEWKTQRMSLRAARVHAMRGVAEELRVLYASLGGDESLSLVGRLVVPLSPTSRAHVVGPPVVLYQTPVPTPTTVREGAGSGVTAADKPTSTSTGSLVERSQHCPMPVGWLNPPGSKRPSVMSTRKGEGITLLSRQLPQISSSQRTSFTSSPMASTSRPLLASTASTRLGSHATKPPEVREAVTLFSAVEPNPSLEEGVGVKIDGAASVYRDQLGFTHQDELYVIADVNSDEFFQKRVGPKSYAHAEKISKLVTELSEQASAIRKMDVNTPDYQSHCAAVARQRIHDTMKNNTNKTNFIAGKGQELEHWADDDPLNELKEDERWCLLWDRSELCTSSLPIQNFDPKLPLWGEEVIERLKSMQLPPANANSLYQCSRYYLTLSRYTASYLVHKALQLLLLPPYGILHRLLTQLIDLCLLQSQPAAARVVDMWSVMMGKAFRSSLFKTALRDFNIKTALAELNEHFRREWQQCVPHGSGTENAYWQLDSNTVENERSCEEGANPSSEANHTYGEHGPLCFLSRLRLCYTKPALGIPHTKRHTEESFPNLLPDNFAEHYGKIFASLLRWKTMEHYATSTWRLGLHCGQVLEVSFFCNTARYLLVTIQRCMWDRICDLCGRYRSNLRFEKGTLYMYTSVEDFTQEHCSFMEECRFGAMLDEAFAPVWDIFMRLMRLIEAVRQMLKSIGSEMSAERRRILTDYDLLDFNWGSHYDSISDTSSEDSCATSFSASTGGQGRDEACGLAPTTAPEMATTSLSFSKAKGTKTAVCQKKSSTNVSASKVPGTTPSSQGYQASRDGDTSKKADFKHSGLHASITNVPASIKEVRQPRRKTRKVVRKKRKTHAQQDKGVPPGASNERESLEHRRRLYRKAEQKISEAHEPLRRRLRDGIKLHLRGFVAIIEELIEGFCRVRDDCTIKGLDEIQNLARIPHVAFKDSAQGGHEKRSGGKNLGMPDPIDNIKRKNRTEYCQRALTERISILTALVDQLQTALDLLSRKF